MLTKLRCKQQWIANELNVSQQCVSSWFCGRSNPPIVLLPKLAEILHISIEQLVYAIIETKQQNLHKSEVQ